MTDKPLFELPKLLTLSGQEVTEESACSVMTSPDHNQCGSGSGYGNKCTDGG